MLLNREVDDPPGDVCVVDNTAGAGLIARELLELGHRSIAAVFGPQNTSTGRDREDGFRAILAEAGVALAPEHWRRAPFDFDARRRLTLELLESRPTALFCQRHPRARRPRRDQFTRSAYPRRHHPHRFRRRAARPVAGLSAHDVSQDIGYMVHVCTELLLARIAAGPTPRRVARAARAAGHPRSSTLTASSGESIGWVRCS